MNSKRLFFTLAIFCSAISLPESLQSQTLQTLLPEPMPLQSLYFEEYTITLSAGILQPSERYIDVEFHLSSEDPSLQLSNAFYFISWNPEALSFHSLQTDKDQLWENMSEYTPEYGLKVYTEHKADDSALSVHLLPVQKRTELLRSCYIETIRFKVLDSTQSRNFQFKPDHVWIFTESGTEISNFIEYSVSETVYMTEE